MGAGRCGRRLWFPLLVGLGGILLASPALQDAFSAAEGSGQRLSPPRRIAPGEMQEYPDVATDADGTAWVTWISAQDGPEQVMLRTFQGTEGGPVQNIGLPDKLQLAPRVLVQGDRQWVAWSARNARPGSSLDRWQVVVRTLEKGVPGTVEVVSGEGEDALRPALGLSGEGEPWVIWESRQEKRFRVLARPLGAPPGAPPIEVSPGGELNLRPTLAPLERGVLAVWDHYREGQYHLLARPLSPEGAGELQRISDEAGSNLGASAVADRQGRVFIAYATNADGQGGQQVGKTLRVKVLDSGVVKELKGGHPPQIMTAPDRLDAVEFPNLAFDGQGRLWVFARRGQGWIAFAYQGARWLPPLDLSEAGWGGRGRDLRAAWSPAGFHLVSRRLHLCAHQLLTPPSRAVGPPQLEEPPASPAGSADGGVGPAAAPPDALTPPTSTGGGGPSRPHSGPALPTRHYDGLACWLPGEPEPVFASSRRAEAPHLPPPASRPPPAREAHGPRGPAVGAPELPPLPGPPPRTDRPRPQAVVLSDGVGAPRAALATARASGLKPGPGSPLEPRATAGLFFGDLHTHTWLSDGAGEPDEVYTRSRDRYGYDFVAVTDHDLENGNRLLPSEWAYLKLLAEFFDQPGRFVTFVAYEWTDASYPRGGGHRNVYFPGSEAPLFNVAAEAPNSRTLFELLQAEGAVAAPHHIGWTGTDWENVDPSVQRAVEIVSVHGAFEKPRNKPIWPRAENVGMFVRDGLLRGLRFGFLGGSDGHGFPWHYGVSRREDVWRTGLTGLMALSLNRAALHAALMHRHTVATSGPAIGIWLSVNGAPSGSELTVDGAPRIGLRVEGAAALKEAVLVRDGEDIKTFPADGRILDTIYDDDPSPGEHWYYARVVQTDGEVGWASPVWVNMQGRILFGPPDP